MEIFEQDTDVDGNNIKGKTIISKRTNLNGNIDFYLPVGTYMAEVVNPDKQREQFFDISLDTNTLTKLTKTLSSLRVIIKDANGIIVENARVSMYVQDTNIDNQPIEGKRLVEKNSLEFGFVDFYYPPGIYVVRIKGSTKHDYQYFNQIIEKEKTKTIDPRISSIKIISRDSEGRLAKNVSVAVSAQEKDFEGNPILGAGLITVNTGDKGSADVFIPSGIYALTVGGNTSFNVRVAASSVTTANIVKSIKESGEVFEIKDVSAPQTSSASDASESSSSGQSANTASNVELEALRERIRRLEYRLSELEQELLENEKNLLSTIDYALTERMKGRILLQVEERGEAWYVDEISNQKYYLKDGDTAYLALQAFGLGITTTDLEQIPIGFEDRFEDADTDGDNLQDRLEDALGTDPENPDSDGDGFTDGEEVRGGYNPLGPGRIDTTNFGDGLKGKIVLQVKGRGEAWYIHPDDAKRYYMKDGPAAYQIMRYLSLGITNEDLRKIDIGSFE